LDEDWWIDANPPSEVIQMEADEEIEKMALINLDKRRQALADYLEIDPKEVTACSSRINDVTTLQAKNMLYLVGTVEEVDGGIRGCFEHNLSDLDAVFIGQTAKLSAGDVQMVDRLCEILDEDLETDILNEALLGIVKKCGDLESLIDAAVAEVDRGQFLAMDGEENPFGDYLIYRFREGQCSDFDY
jgi:hypothetical protein